MLVLNHLVKSQKCMNGVVMSNTKQQIEEMISDFGEDAIRYGEELHTGRVKSDEEIKADSVELLQKQTEIFEAIDRLVTEAQVELEKRIYGLGTNIQEANITHPERSLWQTQGVRVDNERESK